MTWGGKAGEGSLCVLGSSGDEGEPHWAALGSLIPDPAIKELPGRGLSSSQTPGEVTPGLPGHPGDQHLAGGSFQSGMVPHLLGFDLSVTENGDQTLG